jgi:hypothetical protein
MVAVKRPGVITFIGVLLYINAALAAIASIASFVARGTDEALALGLSDDSLLTSGIAEAIAAVLLVFAAWYLMSGASGARLVVAIVVGIRLALLVWVMLTHHVGGFLWTGLISAGFGLFILWALYGDDRSEKYFEATG